MINWIKNINKEYPDFWKSYLAKFENKNNRYVAVSTLITGYNPKKDVILSFGCFGIVENVIRIGDNFEVVILQYKYLHDNGLSNQFIIESPFLKLSEHQALQKFIEYIGNSKLIGYKIENEIEMINSVLTGMDCGKLKNEVLDVEIMHQKLNDINTVSLNLEELLKFYKISNNETSTTSDVAYSIALLFLKFKSKLGIK